MPHIYLFASNFSGEGSVYSTREEKGGGEVDRSA